MKLQYWLLLVIVPGGLLVAGLVGVWRWLNKPAQNLTEKWRGFLNQGPHSGEPEIPAAKVPPVKPLKGVSRGRPVRLIARFRTRGR